MKQNKNFKGDLNLVFVFSIIAFSFVAVLFMVNWPVIQGHTEMWLVNASYPETVSIGEIVEFSVGLKNMERISKSYTLNLNLGSQFIESYQINLGDGENGTTDISFNVPEKSVFPLKVEIILSDQNNDLWFWLDEV